MNNYACCGPRSIFVACRPWKMLGERKDSEDTPGTRPPLSSNCISLHIGDIFWV